MKYPWNLKSINEKNNLNKINYLHQHITCFRAPTSLVPSPHINVILPTVLKVVMMSSFCSGATLAKTWDNDSSMHCKDYNKKPVSNIMNKSEPSHKEWLVEQQKSVVTFQSSPPQYRDHESLIKLHPLYHSNQ